MIEEKSNKAKEKSEIDFCNINKHIERVVENIVPLYDIIENFLFQDIDYNMVKGFLPKWVMDSGRCPESPFSKSTFEKLHKLLNDPITNRCLHWFDLQCVITAMQDRINAIRIYLSDLKDIVPLYCSYNVKDITNCIRTHGDNAERAYTSINNIFLTINSALDMFGKIMYECQKYDSNDFLVYKQLKSRKDGIVFRGCENKLPLFKKCLGENGLLFSKPLCIEKVYCYRDEYIHNGAWDYRCTIYCPTIDDKHVESFILAPDFNVSGNFEKYGGRNKFYSNGEMINTTIIPLIEEVITIIENSIIVFSKVLIKQTKSTYKKPATMAYMKTLISYYVKLGMNNFHLKFCNTGI